MELAKYWNGQGSARDAVWYVWILPGLLIPFVLALLTVAVGLAFRIPAYQLPVIVFILLLFLNPYYLFAWVSVWRCSVNCESVVARVVIRLLVGASILISLIYGVEIIKRVYE